MLRNFSLLLSILIVGKLIAASHPAYDFNNDLSLAQPTVKIVAPEPVLPPGTTAVKYPLDQGHVNPIDDSSLGIAKPSPLPPVVNPDANAGDLGVPKPPSVTVNPAIGLPDVPPTIPSYTPKAAKSSYTFWPYVAVAAAAGVFIAMLRFGVFSARKK